MLQWRVGGQWSHRAFWGENVIPWGKEGTVERVRIGDLPTTGQWVRLEIPAKTLGLAPGTVDRRLGVHPARRRRLLGPGRPDHLDPAGRPDLRLPRRLGPRPYGQRRRGSAERDSRRSSRSPAPSAPTPSASSCSRRSSRTAGRETRRPSSRSARRSPRRKPNGRRLDDAILDDAGVPRAQGRPQAGVRAEPGRVRPAPRPGRPGDARVPAAAARRARR